MLRTQHLAFPDQRSYPGPDFPNRLLRPPPELEASTLRTTTPKHPRLALYGTGRAHGFWDLWFYAETARLCTRTPYPSMPRSRKASAQRAQGRGDRRGRAGAASLFVGPGEGRRYRQVKTLSQKELNGLDLGRNKTPVPRRASEWMEDAQP